MRASKVDVPASVAIAFNAAASAGNRYESTAADAPDAHACPEGYPGCCGSANSGTIVESTCGGRSSRNVYFASQQASVASCCAIRSNAYTRAARGAFASRWFWKISISACCIHGWKNPGCQNHAEWLVALV